jgi:hypothetical protein
MLVLLRKRKGVSGQAPGVAHIQAEAASQERVQGSGTGVSGSAGEQGCRRWVNSG